MFIREQDSTPKNGLYLEQEEHEECLDFSKKELEILKKEIFPPLDEMDTEALFHAFVDECKKSGLQVPDIFLAGPSIARLLTKCCNDYLQRVFGAGFPIPKMHPHGSLDFVICCNNKDVNRFIECFQNAAGDQKLLFLKNRLYLENRNISFSFFAKREIPQFTFEDLLFPLDTFLCPTTILEGETNAPISLFSALDSLRDCLEGAVVPLERGPLAEQDLFSVLGWMTEGMVIPTVLLKQKEWLENPQLFDEADIWLKKAAGENPLFAFLASLNFFAICSLNEKEVPKEFLNNIFSSIQLSSPLSAVLEALVADKISPETLFAYFEMLFFIAAPCGNKNVFYDQRDPAVATVHYAFGHFCLYVPFTFQTCFQTLLSDSKPEDLSSLIPLSEHFFVSSNFRRPNMGILSALSIDMNIATREICSYFRSDTNPVLLFFAIHLLPITTETPLQSHIYFLFSLPYIFFLFPVEVQEKLVNCSTVLKNASERWKQEALKNDEPRRLKKAILLETLRQEKYIIATRLLRVMREKGAWTEDFAYSVETLNFLLERAPKEGSQKTEYLCEIARGWVECLQTFKTGPEHTPPKNLEKGLHWLANTIIDTDILLARTLFLEMRNHPLYFNQQNMVHIGLLNLLTKLSLEHVKEAVEILKILKNRRVFSTLHEHHKSTIQKCEKLFRHLEDGQKCRKLIDQKKPAEAKTVLKNVVKLHIVPAAELLSLSAQIMDTHPPESDFDSETFEIWMDNVLKDTPDNLNDKIEAFRGYLARITHLEARKLSSKIGDVNTYFIASSQGNLDFLTIGYFGVLCRLNIDLSYTERIADLFICVLDAEWGKDNASKEELADIFQWGLRNQLEKGTNLLPQYEKMLLECAAHFSQKGDIFRLIVFTTHLMTRQIRIQFVAPYIFQILDTYVDSKNCPGYVHFVAHVIEHYPKLKRKLLPTFFMQLLDFWELKKGKPDFIMDLLHFSWLNELDGEEREDASRILTKVASYWMGLEKNETDIHSLRSAARLLAAYPGYFPNSWLHENSLHFISALAEKGEDIAFNLFSAFENRGVFTRRDALYFCVLKRVVESLPEGDEKVASLVKNIQIREPDVEEPKEIIYFIRCFEELCSSIAVKVTHETTRRNLLFSILKSKFQEFRAKMLEHWGPFTMPRKEELEEAYNKSELIYFARKDTEEFCIISLEEECEAERVLQYPPGIGLACEYLDLAEIHVLVELLKCMESDFVNKPIAWIREFVRTPHTRKGWENTGPLLDKAIAFKNNEAANASAITLTRQLYWFGIALTHSSATIDYFITGGHTPLQKEALLVAGTLVMGLGTENIFIAIDACRQSRTIIKMLLETYDPTCQKACKPLLAFLEKTAKRVSENKASPYFNQYLVRDRVEDAIVKLKYMQTIAREWEIDTFQRKTKFTCQFFGSDEYINFDNFEEIMEEYLRLVFMFVDRRRELTYLNLLILTLGKNFRKIKNIVSLKKAERILLIKLSSVCGISHPNQEQYIYLTLIYCHIYQNKFGERATILKAVADIKKAAKTIGSKHLMMMVNDFQSKQPDTTLEKIYKAYVELCDECTRLQSNEENIQEHMHAYLEKIVSLSPVMEECPVILSFLFQPFIRLLPLIPSAGNFEKCSHFALEEFFNYLESKEIKNWDEKKRVPFAFEAAGLLTTVLDDLFKRKKGKNLIEQSAIHSIKLMLYMNVNKYMRQGIFDHNPFFCLFFLYSLGDVSEVTINELNATLCYIQQSLFKNQLADFDVYRHAIIIKWEKVAAISINEKEERNYLGRLKIVNDILRHTSPMDTFYNKPDSSQDIV